MINEVKLTPIKQIFNKADFRIYSCTTKDLNIQLNKYGNCSIKGVMQRLDLGVEYIANIELSEVHPQYGASYECHSIYQNMPSSGEDQRSFFKYLLTEKQVEELFKVYPSEDVIQMIVDDKLDYKKINGIGEKTYKSIRNKVLENVEHKELLSKLGRYGITYNTVMKIAEKYDSVKLAIQKIEDNPYCLCDISGIGFKKADVIARNMGFAYDCAFRIQTGIKFTLEQNQLEGHTYMIIDKMVKAAIENLDVDEALINDQIDNTEGIIIVEEEKIALLKSYEAEKNIAKKLHKIMQNQEELPFDVDEFIAEMELKYKDKMPNGLTHQQKEFFHNIKKNSVNALIGYAGVGKTFIQQLLVELLEKLGLSYVLLSPTGKAAKLLSSYTNRSAQTIHKAIGYGMDKGERQLIERAEDVIIVDETGMVDVFIMQMLLSKLTNPNVRILFCGDPSQLMAVQCGNILHNIIESQVVPITTLDIVFRQSEGGLLDIIHKVRKNERFLSRDFSGSQKFGNDIIVHCVEQNFMEDGYKHYYQKFLNKYDPMDILVLTPTKKGRLGTIAINQYIQSLVNPPDTNKVEHEYGEDTIFRQHDYVMNIKNTYGILNEDDEETTIVNGDSGKVKDIVSGQDKRMKIIEDEDGDTSEIIVDPNGVAIEFDDDTVKLGFNELNQLIHAWSITCHKSQGSSSKAVIVIADRSHKFQLTRNLLYTALSRTSQFCVVLTQAETMNYAMSKADNLRRQTFLKELLQQQLTK